MKEFVWMNILSGELHAASYNFSDAMIWLYLDPQSLERGKEQAEPPMNLELTYECLGEI